MIALAALTYTYNDSSELTHAQQTAHCTLPPNELVLARPYFLYHGLV